MEYAHRRIICYIFYIIMLTGQSKGAIFEVSSENAKILGVKPGTELQINLNTQLAEVPIKVTSEKSLRQFKDFYLRHRYYYCMPADIIVERVWDNWCKRLCCEGECFCEVDPLWSVGNIDIILRESEAYRCQCIKDAVEF